MPSDFINQVKARESNKKTDQFECWIEHEKALSLFCACRTQWKIIPMGGIQGLDYLALEAVLRLNQIPQEQHQDLFNEIQLIELGAIPELNQKIENG